MIILCSKVTLSAKENSNKKFLIQEKVTQAEFDALEKRKTDSMRHMATLSLVPNKLSSTHNILYMKNISVLLLFVFIIFCSIC
jgi:hypothetical protein